ncbi:glycoside hydrolase superfamily [Leptodontidium sp. MPI-SDFR-AT-0119]|nr:glycoside hydrolase superfamily [Leptodontidium sp. MPI-SDFR-AT-0119]
MRFRAFLGLSAILLHSPYVGADYTTTINAKSNRGTWDGWGTSLAWWAREFGDRTDLADIFFTLTTQTFLGVSLPGLGFNIARYNAGASSWNTYSGESMVQSSNIIKSRQVEGYWQDWGSADPTSSSWNWAADRTQRQALTNAMDRGVTRVELFSNSPMWWMCKNHNPSGASDGSENIASWNLEQHAIYMATVAKYFNDNWGVQFESVEPFNEPSASWWKANGTQEGCHIDVSTQATVINYLRSHLDSFGLESVIAASDESYYDQAVTNLQTIGSTAISKIARVNVHGYQYGAGNRNGLYSLVSGANKALWNSEYGDGTASGLDLASNLLLDFRWLLPTAWVYWQAVDGDGWGLVDGDNDSGQLNTVNQKYWVLAQFTRHIRPGMRILDGGSSNVVAAYDSSSNKLVIVAVNYNTAQYINFDLSSFSKRPADGTAVVRWSTQISGGDRYVQHSSDTTISGSKFWSYFSTNNVQTFEVTGVSL